MIEKKLEKICDKAMEFWMDENSTKYLYKCLSKAILSSPDIAVVEKDKLQKMQKVLVGLLEDCKLNLEAIGGCDHEVGICVCGVMSLIADAEEALADLEG